MRKYIYKSLILIGFLFLLYIPNSVFSKSYKNYIDSLKTAKTTNVEQRYSNYIEIAGYYYNHDSKQQRYYLDSAQQLLSKIKDAKLKNQYYYSFGRYHYQTGYIDSAIYYMHLSKSKAKRQNFVLMYGKSTTSLGRYYSKLDNYDSALFYYSLALEFYNKTDSSKLNQSKKAILADHNNNIGSIYLNMGNYDSAIVYYYRALSFFEEAGLELKQAMVLNNLGNIYIYHNEYDKALIEYRKALNILQKHKNIKLGRRASLLTNIGSCYKAKGKLDTAMNYYNQAMKIRNAIGPPTSIAGLYANIGNIKKAHGDYKGALNDYMIALNIRKKGGSKRGLASSYGNIGLLYVKMNKNQKAITYLKRAIEISDSNSFVEISLVCQEGLSVAYQNIGDYKKSLETYVKYREQNDSIHNIHLEEKLELYKQKYETEKKDRLIQKLEEEQLIADLESEKQKAIVSKQRFISNSLAVVAMLLLFILFIIYRYFKMKQRADKEMMLKNEQINQQKTLDLMKEQEVSTIKSYMEGQEKERSRIAADLHDRLGSLLSTVKLHFSSIEPNIEQTKESINSFDYALKLLDTSVEEVRSVSRNLSKGVLTQFGLFAAVESMRDAINSANKMKMHIIQSGTETRLKPEIEISLFRIIQELVTNVIRHAQTDEIFVQFVGSNDRLNIIVEDHGVGFDNENIKSNGIGLSNLKRRVEDINGEFSVDSELGEGTTIIIDIPYETET
jgi:signal transduction histidine kinase/Flp pilus assembly protein TadD